MSSTRQLGMTRRRFLAAVVAAAGLLALGNAGCHPAIVRRLRQAESRRVQQHGVWVWQFSIDGSAEEIADTLAAYGLAAIVKTHDGATWMAAYDDAGGAIAGPDEVAAAAGIFERAGVPFHAWCVVTGVDPVREAEMAAQVLDAGARSITLDLEPGDGFWAGTSDDALRYCYELRQRQEFARIDVSIDPRPWKMLDIPLGEFAASMDGIRPQMYWDLFNDVDHANAYAHMGFPSGPDGITPEFLVDATSKLLAPFDRWVLPIGAGDPNDGTSWARFMRACWERQLPEMSAWRYGVTTAGVLQALADSPPGSEPPAV